MTTKKYVFASRSERDNYYKLHRAWGDKYRIYHNLPFLNVFDTSNLIDITDRYNPQPLFLTDIEVNRLKKTSIDYTLCDERDSPILCIEFDGIQDGFNVGTKYYPNKLNHRLNPWRREITELKLKVALGSLFPFFVVGYKQFDDIPAETNLTIMDGIIGVVLAFKATDKEVASFNVEEKLGMSQEEFDELSESDQHDLIEDWLIGVEVMSDLENNPLIKRRWELATELGVYRSGYEPLNYPPFKPGDLEGFKSVILHGAGAYVETKDGEKYTGEVWLPNFNVPGFSPYGLVKDIATLIALERLKHERRKRKS